MRYVVVDLEATCWEDARGSPDMEIIEIGAVHLPAGGGPADDEFARFVRPVVRPRLSDFCTRLTSIRQEDVDPADAFPLVFPAFVDWIGDGPFVLCSWGAYDLNQFRLDCRRHRVPLPPSFDRHINLKAEFARQRCVKACGMAKALQIAGLPLAGTHHRAIDDARNIAALATLLLPRTEDEGAVPAEAKGHV
jgi:inhibitor of KinA sporulation pathway (predicted exonuclease)